MSVNIQTSDGLQLIAGMPPGASPATSDKLGIVKPDNTTITVNAEGTISASVDNKMDKDNPTGTGSFSMGRKANTTIGMNSFACGNRVTSSGLNSHAEGYGTEASGDFSHTEGFDTTASGGYGSHAEGSSTLASGEASHAEGSGTEAMVIVATQKVGILMLLL